MICPRCESFAALVGELTLDRDHLRNELNKRKGDIVTTNNSGVVEQIRAGLTSAVLILWMAEKYAEGGGSRSVEMEEFTQAKADIDAAIAALSRLAPPCRHENLDMDGVCKSCGVDCRGIGADPLKGTAFAEAGRVVDALLNSPPSAQEQPASTPATTTPPASATESPATQGAKKCPIGVMIPPGFRFVDVRRPKKGEWFIYGRGMEKADFDYHSMELPILEPLAAANAGESKVAELEKTIGALWTIISRIREPIGKTFVDRTMPFAEFRDIAVAWRDSIVADAHPDELRAQLAAANSELERLRGVNAAMQKVIDAGNVWRECRERGSPYTIMRDKFAEALDDYNARATPPAPPRDKGMAETQGQWEQFRRCVISRGIPFAYVGMRIEVDGRKGVIVGHNGGANLQVMFDGESQESNCHPHWETVYYHQNGEVAADYRKKSPATGPSDANASQGVQQ